MRKRTTTDRDSGYGPRAGAFLVVAVVLAPNVLTGCGGSNPAAVSRSIPERIRSVALREFEGEYGRVSEVYGQGATDLKRWQELAPSNTSGLQGGPNNPDDPIYALFVRGQFTVVGPPGIHSRPSEVSYAAGRVVFGADGIALSVELWKEELPAIPPFGPAFDDR
jgi:hypothetical protein